MENKRERDKVQSERESLELKKESEDLKNEKDKIEKEFQTYKTRVHSVLKQQKEQKTDPNQLEQVCTPLYTSNIGIIFIF